MRAPGLARALFGPLGKQSGPAEDGHRYFFPVVDGIELSLTVLSRNSKARQLTFSRPAGEDWRAEDFGPVDQRCFNQGGHPFHQVFYKITGGPLSGAWLYWSVKEGEPQPDVEVTLETEAYARADEGAQTHECATTGRISGSRW